MRRLPIWWFVATFAAAAYCAIVVAFGDRSAGGTQLVFAIDDEAFREARAIEVASGIERSLAQTHAAAKVVTEHGRVELRFDDPGEARDIQVDPAVAERDACTRAATLCFRVKDLEGDARRAGLERSVRSIRERLNPRDVSAVLIRGDEIVVETIDPDVVPLITRTAKLEMKVVDDCATGEPCTAQTGHHTGSPYMKRLYQKVLHSGDPAALSAGITIGFDSWDPEAGGTHEDYYLRASDRGAIEKYLAALATADASYNLPDDREIGYELVEPAADAKDPKPYWRTYYLERRPALTGGAIASATASYDPNTNRRIVSLELTRSGGEAFGDLTTQIVGMKLATVLDGTVKSAPVINGPIRGGRATITMGGSDPAQGDRDARDLVAAINAGTGAPLREVSAREFPGLTGVAWPKLVPGLAVLLGLVAFAVVRRRAA